MIRPLHVLASIPRSGSTLLASLLNQRTDTFVSPTSSLGEVISTTARTFLQGHMRTLRFQKAGDVLSSTMAAHYRDRREKFVFDKGRYWPDPDLIKLMVEIQGDIKIVTTVRPMVECVASYVRLIEPKDVKSFCYHDPIIQQLMFIHDVMSKGYEAHPDSMLLIDYDDLVANPLDQLHRIADFIGAPRFNDFDFNNIQNTQENDNDWGIKGLHDLRSVVGTSDSLPAKEVLGEELFNFFKGGEFWNKQRMWAMSLIETTDSSKEKDALDHQVDAGLRGNIKQAKAMNDKLLLERADCSRVRFNSGWFSLHGGDLQKGHKGLDEGRKINVFGNDNIGSASPQWDGQSDSSVLLNLEGGLGDQIHGYRFAEYIAARNNKVIVSCSPELASIFAEKFPVIEHNAVLGVYHDYWVPSMSAIRPLGYTYEMLNGEPYIDRVANCVKGRIGIRWSGNPKFAHEQHRLFPENLMFDAVRDFNCISLQKDDGSDLRPHWMPTAKLDTWEDTRKSISECELVISSCTSIAHLSAAMGVETWIVIPVLPYYLWALPGKKTPYYGSVTLFRQEKYENWEAPFKNIKEKLKNLNKIKIAA